MSKKGLLFRHIILYTIFNRTKFVAFFYSFFGSKRSSTGLRMINWDIQNWYVKGDNLINYFFFFFFFFFWYEHRTVFNHYRGPPLNVFSNRLTVEAVYQYLAINKFSSWVNLWRRGGSLFLISYACSVPLLG